MTKLSIVFLALISFFVTKNLYAEGAGLHINNKNVKISIRYNDNVEDKITGVNYIREASGALFDVTYLLQQHNSSISTLKKNITIKINNDSGRLRAYQKEEPSSVLLKLNEIKHLKKDDLLSAVCKGLSIEHCTIDNNATIDLFISNSHLSNKSSDLIEFGCFPCRNDRSIALSDRYTPAKPNPYPPAFKKVTVNKKSIYHYFNKLRE